MAKKRIYVPVDEGQLSDIKEIALKMDRSEAWVAAHLIEDGRKFNLITHCVLDPNADIVVNFKQTH